MESGIILNESILASVLQINNIDISTLHENQKKTDYFKTLPNYSPLLLIISCNINKIYSSEISLNAAIQLKNYIKSYWKNETKEINIIDEGNIIISEKDKSYIREKLIEAIIYVIEIENKMILKQYKQCIKTILKYDFRKNQIQNMEFINKIIFCLNSKNIKQIYAGIILFGQLSKIYEFDNEDNQKIYNEELIKVNNYLLSSLYECKNINEDIQANFAFKIIKIFFRSFQGAIPELFTQENIFDKWINFIINIIKTPINEININKEINVRNNIFYKLKRICYQTITRIMEKYSRYLNKKEKTPFAQMINDKYIKIFFDIYKTIFINHFNNKVFIDEYGKTSIYIFFSILMENKDFNQNVIDLFIKDSNNILLNNIVNDCFLSYQDLELWSNDPKKYLADKMEYINEILTKRYNSSKLFTSLWMFKDKNTGKFIYYNTLYDFLCNLLINENNDLNSEKQNLLNNLNNKPYYLIYNQIPFCLRKESILYIIKSNSHYVLKYSKNTIENFIEKVIYPEFDSPCAFLREQACSFLKEFHGYNYTNKTLIENITKGLSVLMQNDPVLQVRFESALALSSILNQKYVKELLKGNILPLLQIYIKLMDETDLEEIIDSLQDVVQNFTEESKMYIVHLSEYLNKYFNKLVNDIKNKEEKNEDNDIDEYSLINNIINTFCNFIHYFVNDIDIYPNIQNYLDNLINFCVISIPENKLEEGINILKEILISCKKMPNHVLNFFIPLINIIIEEKDSELFGNENLSSISQLICYYISKDFDNILLKTLDKEGKYLYINYIMKYIRFIIKECDREDNYDYYEYIYIFNICNNLFERYRNNNIDNIFQEILELIMSKYKSTKNKNLLNNICLLLSTCFIYFPEKCLIYLNKKCCLKEIFMFWFFQIDKIKNYKHFKYNLFAICSIITLNKNQQDKLIIDNINLLVDKMVILLEKINERIQKEEKKEEKEAKEIKEDNDEELDGDELFKKLIVEGKDISDDDDEEDDNWEEDEEEEDFPETEADKQDPILLVKNCFDMINKNFPELFDNIIKALGNNVDKLKNIFSKREEQIKNNVKK